MRVEMWLDPVFFVYGSINMNWPRLSTFIHTIISDLLH